MPIYEYSCAKCGKKVELLQKIGAQDAGVPCPACGEDALKKQLSVTSPAQMAKGAAPACPMPDRQGACGGCCGGCH